MGWVDAIISETICYICIMIKRPDIDKELSEARKKAWKQRAAAIATTVIIVICCVAVVVMKRHARQIAAQQIELPPQTIDPVTTRGLSEEKAQCDWENKELEDNGRHDSIATLPKIEEPAPYTPKYTWDELETMVRSLTNEDYYASVWCVEMNTPKWVVLYRKGGKTYFRHFNPEKKTYGTKVRLIMEEIGKFHSSGNKRDRYYYGNGGTLIHEVNGVQKETFFNHRTIDLFTPEPVPDGYDDWEDYYYDNEEDFRYYYGR